jgi:hypothetical protein
VWGRRWPDCNRCGGLSFIATQLVKIKRAREERAAETRTSILNAQLQRLADGSVPILRASATTGAPIPPGLAALTWSDRWTPCP